VRNISDEASKTFLGMLKTRKKRMDYTRHMAGYRGEASAEEEEDK